VIGAPLLTTDSIALYVVNTLAICHFGFKFPLKTQRRAHILDPLRDGSEKDEGFPHRARETIVARYKRLLLGVVGWCATRKVIGFFGHVTQQVSGWREKRSGLKTTDTPIKEQLQAPQSIKPRYFTGRHIATSFSRQQCAI
jgi:hypothetical protein